MNIYELHEFGSSEIEHTRGLWVFMNPEADHGLDDHLLNFFLSSLSVDVDQGFTINKFDRPLGEHEKEMDITILGSRDCVGIEMKTTRHASTGELERKFRAMTQEYEADEYHLVYLSQYADVTPDPAIDSYAAFTWEDIVNTLQQVEKDANIDWRGYLRSFLENVQNNVLTGYVGFPYDPTEYMKDHDLEKDHPLSRLYNSAKRVFLGEHESFTSRPGTHHSRGYIQFFRPHWDGRDDADIHFEIGSTTVDGRHCVKVNLDVEKGNQVEEIRSQLRDEVGDLPEGFEYQPEAAYNYIRCIHELTGNRKEDLDAVLSALEAIYPIEEQIEEILSK